MPPKGSITPFRTRQQERRTLLSKYYLRGMRQDEIALELGISQATVSRQLRKLREEWREARLHELDEIKTIELAKIDALEAEAWAEYERSKKPATRTQTEKGEGFQGNYSKAKVQKDERLGDAKFLNIVMNCIDRRIKLLGLDAPTKVSPTDAQGNELPGVMIYIPDNGRSHIGDDGEVIESTHRLLGPGED